MDLIRLIFAYFCIFANTIYSHNSFHILFELFAQIRKQIFDLVQNKYMLKRIFALERIFASIFSHTGEYSLPNFRFEANIRKTSSEFHIQAKSRLQTFAYKRIFASNSHIFASNRIFAAQPTLKFPPPA